MADLLLGAPPIRPTHGSCDAPQSPKRQKRSSASSQPLKPFDRSLIGTVSKTVKGAAGLWRSWKDSASREERERARLIEERKNILYLRIKSAETLAQWQAAAQELDALEGNDDWKQDACSGDYNTKLIEDRLRALDEARESRDIRTMMHLIRTALSRDLGGMSNVDLYRHSHLGTKTLIERYVESTIETIDAAIVHSATDQGIAYKDLLEGMLLARQSFGRSALLLSGGGTFGMAHVGVLKALFEAQLLPRIISGASAGSIVCAVMCTRTDEEIPLLLQEFPYGDLAVFEAQDSQEGLLGHFRRLLTEGCWSDIANLRRVMRGMLGDITFQEAYNRTRRILNICVSSPSVYELPRLLNYVTSPNVMIWSAVAASCSVPLIFDSSPLLVKDPITGEHRQWNPTPQRFIDGSVDNDLPMTRLAEMFNVNHFIVSQVNPHVTPFLSKDDHLSPENRHNPKSTNASDDMDWLYTCTSLARDEALHRLQFMAEMGFFPNMMTKFRSILSQKYSGNINILPDLTLDNLPVLLSNPTVDFMLKCCLVGERATWPRLSRIRDSCAIELALDRAVHRLRTRVVFSESQSNLRSLVSYMGILRLNKPDQASNQPSLDAPVAGHGQKRQRRRSGGSLRILPGTGLLLQTDVTDEDTAEEERLEIASRGPGAAPSASLRKPQLKRSCMSQTHVPQLSAAQSHIRPNPKFNFSKPLTPPQSVYGDADLANVILLDPTAPTTIDDDGSDRVGSLLGHVVSPVDEMETSEPNHTSDTDAEQMTEESDPDDSQSAPLEGVAKPAGSGAFGTAGQVISGSW
ncbi:nte family [Trichoderma cornu-damae]|uniref:Patatin-like phospholipase domain-containing protein n=1 Tax=Trichoderma cornu-damae TaxID=654480 RepID=A0A9P8TY06_9HYPO|nr:nte family [Trichoderma cornu-damae]